MVDRASLKRRPSILRKQRGTMRWRPFKIENPVSLRLKSAKTTARSYSARQEAKRGGGSPLLKILLPYSDARPDRTLQLLGKTKRGLENRRFKTTDPWSLIMIGSSILPAGRGCANTVFRSSSTTVMLQGYSAIIDGGFTVHDVKEISGHGCSLRSGGSTAGLSQGHAPGSGVRPKESPRLTTPKQPRGGGTIALPEC